MDNLQKAKALLTDRNINLTEIAKNSDIPYESLKALRYNPEKIKKQAGSVLTNWQVFTIQDPIQQKTQESP